MIGILKTMQEGMEKDLAEITQVEDTAITTFEGLVSAKEKEIAAATEAIEATRSEPGAHGSLNTEQECKCFRTVDANGKLYSCSTVPEVKTERAGETAVQVVSLKNDLEDTKDSLGADERFLMELKKSCSTKSRPSIVGSCSRARGDCFVFPHSFLVLPSRCRLRILFSP